ncbi:hypothetical protein ARMGADRAFT_204804 [Armillaria gallica]|uniref:Uncharacterized protein n=1 Tax=Armillaria gallica TaxID=47427 RepID=A0A2H3DJ32_ARMGA|nr:hypothetical protein ARMGADRAFT_204804 [Armillaria gallica]
MQTCLFSTRQQRRVIYLLSRDTSPPRPPLLSGHICSVSNSSTAKRYLNSGDPEPFTQWSYLGHIDPGTTRGLSCPTTLSDNISHSWVACGRLFVCNVSVETSLLIAQCVQDDS